MRPIIPIFISASLALAACGPAEPDDYDRACASDDECVVAYLVRDCDCSEVTAVNVSASPEVEADNEAESRRAFCPFGVVACDFGPMEAYCDAGICEARAVDFEDQ